MRRAYTALLILLLTGALTSVLGTSSAGPDVSPVERMSPHQVEAARSSSLFWNVLTRDLNAIAEAIPEILNIDATDYSYAALVRINYTDGLTDAEKIGLQFYVQDQLEPKWYAAYVELNWIYTPPEFPPPWPPFAIGELIVGFISQLPNPILVPDHYPTIQAAINVASNGDTVFVRNGTYYENVVVNKSISVVGEGSEVTSVRGIEEGSGSAFHVTESGVTLRGFSMGLASYGVYLLGANDSHVSDNHINDVHIAGVVLESSCNNTVNANVVDGFPSIGIAVAWDSEQNTIRGNVVSGCHDYGLSIVSTNNRVIDNLLLDNGAAFYVIGVGNSLYHNSMINNSIQVIGGELNLWDNGCEGNYWSNYHGTDLNGDGVGDTDLPWEGVDHYPLMNIYWTPADIDHDLDVDIFDVVKCALAYGATPSDPNWNPHCDIAEPLEVINIFDLVMIAASYGEKYAS